MSLKKSSGAGYRNQRLQPYSCFVPAPPVRIPKFPIPKDLFVAVIKNLKPSPEMSEATLRFIEILEKIKNSQKIETTEKNHFQILKMLLYAEEIQNDVDMEKFDQKTQLIKLTRSHYKFKVEDLVELKTKVRRDDKIEVLDFTNHKNHFLKVAEIQDDHIVISPYGRKSEFSEKYSPENVYRIRFKNQNYTLRCSHYSLSLVALYKLTPIFFPKELYLRQNLSNDDDLMWFNTTIKNNPEQKRAVLSITAKTSKPAPYILYGPPGTGKTSTLVEAICQIYHKDTSEKILVCTPSNSASDVITRKLLESKVIYENDIFRMYSLSREGSTIDDAIVGCSNYVEGKIMMLPKSLVIEKRIIICTLVTCIRLIFMELQEKHFSYIFIDEAGQCIEPESMIPFNLSSSPREGRAGKLHAHVILAGDPQQLGPGIRSKIAEPLLGKSLLERLMNCKPYMKNEHNQYNPYLITKLVQNYRSHPKIIQVSNELFYENELKACGNSNIKKAEDWTKIIVEKKFPIVFHGVEGKERRFPKSPSVYNIEEIETVVKYVKLLFQQKHNGNVINQEDIGIITPFLEQKNQIKRALEQDNYDNIEIGTVETFQGQEKDIIIISTVRNNIYNHGGDDHIGFLSNQKRFNVALTRAKALLIVIGNPLVLQIDKHWKYFLNFCKINNACKGTQFYIEDETKDLLKSENLVENPFGITANVLDNSVLKISLDDGVDPSSDSGTESPSTSTIKDLSKFKIELPKVPVAKGIHKAPRSEATLSDVTIKKMSDIKLEKLAAKKEKKKKKKNIPD